MPSGRVERPTRAAPKMPAKRRTVPLVSIEPSAELSYGCVEWFPYERYRSESRRDGDERTADAASAEQADRPLNH